MIKVKSVSVQNQSKISVSFSDGKEGTVNIERDFKKVFSLIGKDWYNVKLDNGVVRWNDNVDIAPEALYFNITGEKCW